MLHLNRRGVRWRAGVSLRLWCPWCLWCVPEVGCVSKGRDMLGNRADHAWKLLKGHPAPWAGLGGARPVGGGACEARRLIAAADYRALLWTAALREPWGSWLGSSSRRFWGCGCCCAAGGAPGAPSCGPRQIRSVGDGGGGRHGKGAGARPAPGGRYAVHQAPRPRRPPGRARRILRAGQSLLSS